MSRRWRWWAASAVALALLALTPRAAAPHLLSLVSSEPPGDGSLCTSAPRVAALFSGELDVKESRFTLRDASGRVVGEGSVDLQDVERRRLAFRLEQPLLPGDYTVDWRAVSNDDKQETLGSFRFTAQACLEPPWRALALAGVIAAVVGSGIVVVRQRRQEAPVQTEEDGVATEVPRGGSARAADD